MARVVDPQRSMLLQRLVILIGTARQPFVETGRKYDKVYVNGKVTYFVARQDLSESILAGDIYGAKSKLAPNLNWYFGKLENADKWDWSNSHPRPVSDTTVLATKGYGQHVHYKRVMLMSN